MKLRVALLTDIHHGVASMYVRGSAALPLLRQALTELERLQPALFVELGDRSNQPEVAEAGVAVAEVAAGFHRISRPKVHRRGNHDVTTRLEQETLLGVPLGNSRQELGGWQLISLGTWHGSVGGALSPQTLAWLERTLVLSELSAVVFSHQLLDGQPLPRNAFFGGPYRHQAYSQGHGAARRIMARSGGVKLAVGGHAHWHHSVKLGVGEIRYLTLAALVPYAEGEDEGGSYGLLTLDSDALRLEVYRCGSRACRFQAVINREAPRA